MKNDDNKRSNELSFPSRKSPRADFHDYSGGDYFITICTKNKSHYFGEITKGQMRLSPLGEFTTNAIDSLHSHYLYAEVRVSIVMPNHLHMIIHIDTEEKNTRLPKQRTALSVIVGGLKQSITCFAKRNNLMFGWQGRYHDHIIRGVQEGNRIEEYILNNVARWADDCFYSPVP